MSRAIPKDLAFPDRIEAILKFFVGILPFAPKSANGAMGAPTIKRFRSPDGRTRYVFGMGWNDSKRFEFIPVGSIFESIEEADSIAGANGEYGICDAAAIGQIAGPTYLRLHPESGTDGAITLTSSGREVSREERRAPIDAELAGMVDEVLGGKTLPPARAPRESTYQPVPDFMAAMANSAIDGMSDDEMMEEEARIIGEQGDVGDNASDIRYRGMDDGHDCPACKFARRARSIREARGIEHPTPPYRPDDAPPPFASEDPNDF